MIHTIWGVRKLPLFPKCPLPMLPILREKNNSEKKEVERSEIVGGIAQL